MEVGFYITRKEDASMLDKFDNLVQLQSLDMKVTITEKGIYEIDNRICLPQSLREFSLEFYLNPNL